jgi:hypothetical protein
MPRPKAIFITRSSVNHIPQQKLRGGVVVVFERLRLAEAVSLALVNVILCGTPRAALDVRSDWFLGTTSSSAP